MPKLRGFTLIELLVVISIISILAAIGLVAYSAVLKQGQDSKRQSDLRLIQSALDQYFTDQSYYPLNSASCSNGTFKIGCALKDPSGGKTYLSTIPSDPTGSPQYSYAPSPSSCDNSTTKCTSYCLYAKLESSSPGKPSACTNATYYNFAVIPP